MKGYHQPSRPGVSASIKKPPRFIRKFGTYKYYYLLLLPLLAWFIIFYYIPMYGVVIAFKDYKILQGIMGSPWAKPLTKYFARLLKSAVFRQAFSNTLVISGFKILFGFPAPIIFALLLNEIRGKLFKKCVQTISYLPYFISWVIIGGILRQLLSINGPVNQIAAAFGGEPVLFLGSNRTFRGVLVISSIWASIGWNSIIYLAAIAGIDTEQYEAATIDGETRLQMMWHITLPSIRPTISILFILGMGSILSAGFDQVFNLYSESVYATGDILDTYIFRVGLENFDYSVSTALSLFKNVIGLMLVLLTNFVATKIGGRENALW